jgi:hypothetical protein
VSLAEKAESRKLERRNGRQPGLHDVLRLLGFTDAERVSINSQLPGSRFQSTIYRAGDLRDWNPPQDRNVWFGVNPVGTRIQYGRGSESDIVRARTLFADLDVKPGKQFDALEQCETTVQLLKDYVGLAPTVVVESGHGLQPIWRIGSPRADSNVIGRCRNLDDWKRIYQCWGGLVQRAAREVLWSPDGSQNSRGIDNVFELARVLRCPGSVNWKHPDKPVPVVTRLDPSAGRVRPADLNDLLVRADAVPLARTRPRVESLPTSFGEADEWIHAQGGAELEVAELRGRSRSRVLVEYLEPAELVQAFADAPSAHDAMRNKALHAVLSAQEGRAGLAFALNNVRDAYLEVMERRRLRELDGEARPEATAIDDVCRAVVGAVARARGRESSARFTSLTVRRTRYRRRYQPEYLPKWQGRS